MATTSDGKPTGQLRQVYDIDDPREIRDYYDAWAQKYDDELEQNGYASPTRVAQAMAALVDDLDVPILDYGCGTGMSGQALIAAGFTVIDGADPSAQMLEGAQAKDIYRSLAQLDLDVSSPPFEPASYAAVTAIGLIGPGAAPLELFDDLLDLVAPNGLFGLSWNDHALTIPAYPAKLASHIEAGTASIAFEEHGPHLPGLGVDSTVYVLRRHDSRSI